jgi:hypothetical protein
MSALVVVYTSPDRLIRYLPSKFLSGMNRRQQQQEE